MPELQGSYIIRQSSHDYIRSGLTLFTNRPTSACTIFPSPDIPLDGCAVVTEKSEMDHESRFVCSRDRVDGGGVEKGGAGEAVAEDRRIGIFSEVER